MGAKKVFTHPRKLLVLFIPLFLVGFGVSWGVSYLWMLHMDNCCKSTIGDKSYASIAYMIIFFISIWTLKDMYNKAETTKAINRVVIIFSGLLNVICSASSDQSLTNGSYIMYQRPDSQSETRADNSEATVDLLVGAVLTIVLFFVDTKQRSHKAASAEAKNIVQETYSEVGLAHDLVKDLFLQQETKQRPTLTMLVSLELMIDYMERTVTENRAQGISFVKRPDLIKDQIHRMRAKIMDTSFVMKVTSRYRWIQLPITMMGVLCPFLLPPIFYSTMAGDILYVGPVIFFFLGGIVLLNVFICDPVSFPLDVYSDPIYDMITSSVVQAASKYNAHFNKKNMAALIDKPVTKMSQDELRQVVKLYQSGITPSPEHVSRDAITATLNLWMTHNNNEHID